MSARTGGADNTVAETTKCAECEEPLTPEEIAEPVDRGDGNICNECDYLNHHWRCDFCQDSVDEDQPATHFAVFDADAAGVEVGIYRILSCPFYTQALIGGGWIHKDAVERVADLPADQEEGFTPCSDLCSECVARYVKGGRIMATVSAAKAPAKMHRTEADEQKALFTFLRTFAYLAPEFDAVHASLNGIHLPTDKLKAEASAQGMTAGVWDVFCPSTTKLLYAGIQDAGLYIEMKVPGNDLTDEQKAFRERLSVAYRFEVCKSWHEAACKIVAFYRVGNSAIREALQ